MKYGIERETTELDDRGSTLTVIKKWRDGEVAKTYKQFKERSKVRSEKEQMVEYMKHADKVFEKHRAGILVVKDEDPSLYAAFWTEYPKFDQDGSWFVISSWCEAVNG